MNLRFSVIIPVYNRPEEVDELLHSFENQTYTGEYEIIIVEDGSQRECREVVDRYRGKLPVRYLKKQNTGPGLSRNFGMKNARGNYFIILDSDVIVPPLYLETVHRALSTHYTGVFGAPDRAHPSFDTFQKAVSYAMTSYLTTGGLRGHKKNKRFQLRSFNMGMSRAVYEKTGGFGSRRIGEDIEFSYRISRQGFSRQYIDGAYVYHKRRSSPAAFFRQMYRFGRERPALDAEFAGRHSLFYSLPSIFTVGLVVSLFLAMGGILTPLYIYFAYFLLIAIDSTMANKDIRVGLVSVPVVVIQFAGYGLGYIRGYFRAHDRT